MGTSERAPGDYPVMFVQVFGPVMIQKVICDFYMGEGKFYRKNIQEKLGILHRGKLLTLSKHQLQELVADCVHALAQSSCKVM